MNIQHHRSMKPGPEATMMEAVFKWSRTFAASAPYWGASSIPVGAGMPDFVLAKYKHDITNLTANIKQHASILAYLRLVRKATPLVLAEQINQPQNRVRVALEILRQAGAVEQRDDTFRLKSRWRQILPLTIAIEAKVSDWRKAVEQASRNAIFVHYSYVALPDRVAQRVQSSPLFDKLGIGVMEISESGVLQISRQARRTDPIAWYYYYKLALTLSQTHKRDVDAFPSSDS